VTSQRSGGPGRPAASARTSALLRLAINDQLRTRTGADAAETVRPQPELDYYLLLAPTARERSRVIEGVLVEEFARGRDHSTVGLSAAIWTADDPRWLSCASLSRTIRTDTEALARVVPTDRGGAELAYRRLCGGPLPGEAAPRSSFLDHESLAAAPPLRLRPVDAPDGFQEKRLYRTLFAKDLHADQLTALGSCWSPPRDERGAGPSTPELPAGSRTVGDDLFAWGLRRIGPGIAWGLDVTVLLAAGRDHTVGPVLHELTQTVRRHGLIPVTTERFT
jgi:hypothetical protein